MDRYCVNCKWYKPTAMGNQDYAQCLHPENTQVDPVTGGTRPRMTYCIGMRAAGSPCGPEGLWWTAKEEQEHA